MEWWQALVLGIVEGVTEFLPISSTGHIILAQRAMGIENDRAANAYAICIQGGAILAVLGLYAGRVRQGLRLFGRDREGLRLDVNLIVGFLPAAIVGLLLHGLIEEHLFGLWPVVAAWFVGGVAILAVAWWRRTPTPPATQPPRGFRRTEELPSEKGRSLAELTVTGARRSACSRRWPCGRGPAAAW